jgi:ribosome-binding ATPase YchF (GTP1/OBG family)
MALAPVRTVDALLHVVRAFQDDAVAHSEGSVDPERDKRNLDYELMLADIASIEKRMERLEKDLKKLRNAALEKEQAYLVKAKAWLESENRCGNGVNGKRNCSRPAFLSEKLMITLENVGEISSMFAQSDARGTLPVNTEQTIICGKPVEMSELLPRN